MYKLTNIWFIEPHRLADVRGYINKAFFFFLICMIRDLPLKINTTPKKFLLFGEWFHQKTSGIHEIHNFFLIRNNVLPIFFFLTSWKNLFTKSIILRNKVTM